MHSRWNPGCARSVCCSVYCSTSAVDLAVWVVLMFPCVEEMKRPGWAEGRHILCPCSMEEILEGRNLEDETFPQLFLANGLEASPRLALEVQSSRQESGSGGMSVLGWKMSFAVSPATVL